MIRGARRVTLGRQHPWIVHPGTAHHGESVTAAIVDAGRTLNTSAEALYDKPIRSRADRERRQSLLAVYRTCLEANGPNGPVFSCIWSCTPSPRHKAEA